MLYAAVCFKGKEDVIGDDMTYEDISSWKIRGNALILTRSRHEHIIIPLDSFTSAEIRPDREEGE